MMKAVQRANVYGFLARLFSYPRRETFEILSHEDIFEAFNGLGEKLIAQAYQIIALLRTLGYEEACEEYVQIFGHVISAECPPYETSYGESHVFQQTQGLADIAGFYKAWGIDIASDAHDRLDHISAECEFMSFLLLKLDYFSEKGEKEAEEICLDSSKKFLEEHLGKWTPIFSALVMKKSSGGLYHKAVKLLKEFIEKEAEIFDVEPVIYAEEALRSFPPDNGQYSQCSSCGGEELKEKIN